MQKSKINNVMQSGTSQWKDKTLTKYSVSFEDGSQGTLTTGFNDDDKAPEVGDELEFEVEDKGFGPEIKPKRAFAKGGGGGFKPNPKKEAMITATAIACKLLDKGIDEAAVKASFVQWYDLGLKCQEGAEDLPF